MDRVREFRRRAAECRKSAAQAPTPELRGHYEEMATIWDQLAEERLAFFVTKDEAAATPTKD